VGGVSEAFIKPLSNSILYKQWRRVTKKGGPELFEGGPMRLNIEKKYTCIQNLVL